MDERKDASREGQRTARCRRCGAHRAEVGFEWCAELLHDAPQCGFCECKDPMVAQQVWLRTVHDAPDAGTGTIDVAVEHAVTVDGRRSFDSSIVVKTPCCPQFEGGVIKEEVLFHNDSLL